MLDTDFDIFVPLARVAQFLIEANRFDAGVQYDADNSPRRDTLLDAAY